MTLQGKDKFRIMAQRWRELSNADRTPYEEMATKDRQRFDDEIKEYLRTKDMFKKNDRSEIFKVEKVKASKELNKIVKSQILKELFDTGT